MSQVHDILKLKGSKIWSVSPQETVYNTLKLMAEQNVGAVLVLEGDTLAGIFSERDFARHTVKSNLRAQDVLIKDMMTSKILSVSPETSIDECMTIMTSKHIRHLPVINEEGKLAGLISIGDVVKRIIEDHKFSITQLERYVTGEA